MNDLQRKLIELNDALIEAYAATRNLSIVDRFVQEAKQWQSAVNNNSDDDTIVVNLAGGGCEPCPPGPPGPKGDKGDSGEDGAPGPKGDPGECECCTNSVVIVDSDYQILTTDYYVGVNATGPTTMTLPAPPGDCKEFIIKAEMGPPLGTRKVTIKTSDGSLIDGATSIVLTKPYDFARVIFSGGKWNII